MIDSSKKVLASFLDRIEFICEDALVYLNKTEQEYGIVCSSLTIHNFTPQNRRMVFEAIYSKLIKGGFLLLADKIYPDSLQEQKRIHKEQIQRFSYLDDELRKAIVSHEEQDFGEEYKMVQTETINILKEIGFREIKIIDRVDRDALLIAQK